MSKAAAAFVDAHLAHALKGCSFAQVERTVGAAHSRFDPEDAEARRVAAAEHRRFDVDLKDVDSTDGTAAVFGVLDLADALDLDAALATGAAQLAAAGSTDSLDVRRAKAAGALARGEVGLDLHLPTGEDRDDDATQPQPADAAAEPDPAAPERGRRPRQVGLTHPECVFPNCHRPSTGCDLDHVIPHARGGPTCSCDLAPLCRRHHR